MQETARSPVINLHWVLKEHSRSGTHHRGLPEPVGLSFPLWREGQVEGEEPVVSVTPRGPALLGGQDGARCPVTGLNTPMIELGRRMVFV